jgi:hypothetical protein
MGTSCNSPIDVAMRKVKNAEERVKAEKTNRDTAKKNGNYQRSTKCYNWGNKIGNGYDNNVWAAEESLKRAKEELAKIKKTYKK